MKKQIKILCLMHKHQFGDVSKPLSVEYNGIFKAIKKINKKTYFYDTHNRKNSIFKNNNQIIKIAKKIQPDIIFCHQSSYEIYSETLKILKKLNNPTIINWCSDDSWRLSQHSMLIAKNYDYMITTYKEAHKKYKQNNYNSILSSWGCPDNWIKKKTNIKKKYKYDVLFVGSSYMGRKEIISKLLKDGIDIKCFGYGWKKILTNNQIKKAISAAKINLNFSKSIGSKKQTKARVFEITGLNSFCLTETSNEIKNFFKIKKEIDIFSDYNELKEKINYYLKHNSVREKISNSGYLRCKNNYKYVKIVKKILIQSNKNLKKKNSLINQKNVSYLKYNNPFFFLVIYKKITILLLSLFIKEKKAIKLSRRLLFEIEWRIRGRKTYSLNGWTSNLFNYN